MCMRLVNVSTFKFLKAVIRQSFFLRENEKTKIDIQRYRGGGGRGHVRRLNMSII